MRKLSCALTLVGFLVWPGASLFAELTLSFHVGLPALVNDELTLTVVEAATGLATTATRDVGFGYPISAGSSFGYWLNRVPFLGIAIESSSTLINLNSKDVALQMSDGTFWLQFRFRLGSDPSFVFGRSRVIVGLGFGSGTVDGRIDFTPEVSRKVDFEWAETHWVGKARIGVDWFPGPTASTSGNMSLFADCQIVAAAWSVRDQLYGPVTGWFFGFPVRGPGDDYMVEADVTRILGRLGLEFHRRPKAMRKERRRR